MNTITSIAAKINNFADQFKITAEAVEVTSYRQTGDLVRVFYKLNRTIGKTPEEIAKMTQKVRMLNELIVDPFKDPVDPEPEPEPGIPVTTAVVNLASTVAVDETITATLEFTPTDATDKSFTATANPTGYVELLNGGTLIKGVAAGQTVITYVFNGGNVPNAYKTVEVTEVVKPEPTELLADLSSNDFIGPNATIGDKFRISAIISPDLADQEWDVVLTDPTVVEQRGEYFVCIGVGECSVEVVARAKPTVKDVFELTVTNPNAAAQIGAKFTFKPSWGTSAQSDTANYINVGDTVNLIIDVTGVLAQMDAIIELDAEGATVAPFQTEHRLRPGTNVVVPITFTGAPTDGLVTALIKSPFKVAPLAVSQSSHIMDPAVEVSTVTLSGTPPNMPAQTPFGVSATLDVFEYTPRVVQWAASLPNVIITPDVNNPLNASVNTGYTNVGEEFVVTCTVDGVVGTTTTTTIV